MKAWPSQEGSKEENGGEKCRRHCGMSHGRAGLSHMPQNHPSNVSLANYTTTGHRR
jgi:hypothetical protein